jgi:hypothetical protein
VKLAHYEFVTTEGRWLGHQEWRGRHWQVDDTATFEAPRGCYTKWVVVRIEGLRVIFARREPAP